MGRAAFGYMGMTTRQISTLPYHFLTLFLASSLTLSAQEVETARTPANRSSEPQAYPANSTVEGEALQRFVAFFEPQTVGFFHVYADPKVDPEETYLLRGNKLGSVALQVLPKKSRRWIERNGADAYGAGAIRGMNESLYLVRMDGRGEDRIEMFAIRDNQVAHLRTLAVMEKNGTKMKQTDSYITDIDGDSYLDLMTIKRGKDGGIGKREVFVLEDSSRTWKKTKTLDAPWDSVELFNPDAMDE